MSRHGNNVTFLLVLMAVIVPTPSTQHAAACVVCNGITKTRCVQRPPNQMGCIKQSANEALLTTAVIIHGAPQIVTFLHSVSFESSP